MTQQLKRSERPDRQTSPPLAQRGAPSRHGFAWVISTVVALTFAVFFPVLRNGFVNWDDYFNLVDNPNYRGLTWTQLRWMFSTFHLSLYRPVTWITFGADYLLWGVNPMGYHLTSLLIHAANAAIFSWIALTLLRWSSPSAATGSALYIGAGFAGLLFSLHPLRVEAVAWASARNDLVATLFLLLATICYLRAAADSKKAKWRRKWFAAGLVLYAVSLLAKAIGMTFPFVLLLLDVYPLQRLPGFSRQWLRKEYRWVLLEKLPFLALALGAGAAAVLAKQEARVFHSVDKSGVAVRLAESVYGLAFYLWKTFLPFDLSPLYQRSAVPDPLTWPFLISFLVVLGATIMALIFRRSRPAMIACWLFYGITLLPVLGIIQFGPQVVADRYSYISCMPWALLAGAGFVWLWNRRDTAHAIHANRRLALGVALTIIAVSGFLTWQQCKLWQDSERLWRAALSVDSASSIAHHNLATELKGRGNFREAVLHYRKAIAIDPQHARAHHDLGEISAQQGDFEEAIEHYQSALKIDPRSALTYQSLGIAYAAQHKTAEAVKNLSQAIRLDPDNAKIHNTFGNILAAAGDFSEAAAHYRDAAALDAHAPEPYLNLGNLLSRQNQWEEASSYYRKAILVDPNYAQAHFYLGRILAAQGKLEEAVSHFRAAVTAEPRYLDAHQSLIAGLLELGKKGEALQHYEANRGLLGAPPGRQNIH